MTSLGAWGSRAAALLEDGRVVVAGEAGLMLLDLRTLESRALPTTSGPRWSAIAARPGGREVLAGAEDGALVSWDLESGAQGATLEAAGAVVKIAFTPGGERALVLAGATLHLFDVDAGLELERLEVTANHDLPLALSLSPDGRSALVGTALGVILRFEVSD